MVKKTYHQMAEELLLATLTEICVEAKRHPDPNKAISCVVASILSLRKYDLWNACIALHPAKDYYLRGGQATRALRRALHLLAQIGVN